MVAAMAELHDDMNHGDVDNGQRVKRVLKLSGLVFAIVFLFGIGTGITYASLEDGGFTLVRSAILGVVVLMTLFCVWLAVRILNAPTGEAPPTPKERLNRNLLIACGALGFVMSMLMMFTQDGPDLTNGLLSNDPLQPGIAIVLLVLMGVVLPILSFVWHRSAVDEQEVAAYKDGALWGLNVFMLGLPVWWIAWRGGFVPAPDMIFIYFATIFVMGAVWMWKKYR
jgi:hypothetical protein